MSEKMNNCKISLNTSKEVLLCDVITVEVPNFFTLPEYERIFKITSPTFEFQNAVWYFILRSPGQTYYRGYERDFNVCMKRKTSRVLKQRIFHKITLLDANNKSYYSSTGTNELVKDNEEFLMEYFVNAKPSFDRRDTLTLIIHLIPCNYEATKWNTHKTSQIQDFQDKMPEKKNDSKVLLKFSKKCLNCDVCTLKIPNTVKKHYETEFECKSPSFKFDKETWCFQVHARDPTAGLQVYMLSFERKDRSINFDEKQELNFLYTYQLNDRKIHQKFSSEDHFYEDENKYELCTFNSMKSNNSALGKVTLIFHLFPKKCFEVDADNMPLTTIRDLDLLSDDFKELFANKDTCDTTLCVQDNGVSKEYKVHRTILMARSTVFAAMFQHDTIEKQTGIVKIVDCEPEVFKHFLEYLYCGKLDEVSFNTAFHLYITADKYNIKKLKTFCVQYLMNCLTTENICDTLILSDNYNVDELFAAGQDFFNRNLDEILKTSKWKHLIKDNFCLANKILIEMSSKIKVID